MQVKNLIAVNSMILNCTIIIAFTAILHANSYYISNDGNDNADGKTAVTAWKSLGKVNIQTFSPGDSILFQAGNCWRGEMSVSRSGTPEKWIYYGRYGEGSNPQLLGSEAAGTWSPSGVNNIWQSAGTFTNYGADGYAGNIFFCKDNSIHWGEYRNYAENFSTLKNRYDWTIDKKTLYIYSDTDPNTAYDCVEVTQRDRVVAMSNYNDNPTNYIEWDGIDIHFSKRQGLFAGYPAIRGATGLIFRNMEVSYIGERGSGSAYGLALWHSNTLIENCRFSDCGRRAVSINLYEDMPLGKNRVIQNVIVRNNVFKRGWHTTSLDLSCQLTTTDTMKNIYFYDNIIDDSDHDSIRLTSNQIFTQNGSGVSWVDSVFIVNNIFVYATARNILLENGGHFFIWNNTIVSHNRNLTNNPWSNVGLNGIKEGDFRNNIVYDDLPDNSIENWGVLINSSNAATFSQKDYNLYYTAFPSNHRGFSAHRINNSGNMGYWNTTQWNSYVSSNTLFEQHSPAPHDPNFFNFQSMDYRITDSSAARDAGTVLPVIIATDPLGRRDTLTRHDIVGHPRSESAPSIGAYEWAIVSASHAIPLIQKRQEKITVFPYAANGLLKIEITAPSFTSYAIELYDLQGKNVFKKTHVSQKRYTISAYALVSRMYVMKLIFSNGNVVVRKVVMDKKSPSRL